jgi:two-component system OmpR family sensor kinase
MRRLRPAGLRVRLLLTTLVGSLLAVSVLVATFNLVLDAKLRGNVDGLLRDRAAAQLRTVGVVDGRLSIAEAPDKAAPDTLTWIFAGPRTLERPAVTRASRPALSLNGGPQRFLTVDGADVRLYAQPIVQDSSRLGTLVVGASLGPYRSSAHTALVGSIVLGALTVLGIVVASMWALGRALAPVARMTAAAADWGEHDLSRRFLAGEPHDELSELAATFDRLLDRLSQSLERERRFTAEISHELRTPLAKILAEAELATGRPDAPESDRRALESICVSAESLASSLDALLASARAETSPGPRFTDARTAAEHVARHGRSVAGGLGIAVEVVESAYGARVAAEPDLVERALAPVLENAVRFARHRVDIVIHVGAGQVVFEVDDDGPGVDPAIRDRIFDPGISLGGNGPGSGAGLGLPLARRLAQAAGGEIVCLPASTGASFALRLPACQ